MDWAELFSLVIIIALLMWGFNLRKSNNLLMAQNLKLLKESGKINEIQNEVRDMKETHTDVEVIKMLREKYGLSLIGAKQIFDYSQSEEAEEE